MCSWLRLRLNMMPVTAGILEPLVESIPLGVYASWSVYYLFGINPYLWFAGHWAVWIVLDYIQLRGIQVGCVTKSEFNRNGFVSHICILYSIGWATGRTSGL